MERTVAGYKSKAFSASCWVTSRAQLTSLFDTEFLEGLLAVVGLRNKNNLLCFGLLLVYCMASNFLQGIFFCSFRESSHL